MATTILFVDSNVKDYETLLACLGGNVEAHLLNALEDGVLQIASVLEGRTNLDSIQILSHGSSGALLLGSSILTASNVVSYSDVLRQIGSSLSKHGDILLYGCNVAQGDLGSNFINQLSAMTGADVAASNDLTGNAASGGNWNLEAQTGLIESLPALNVKDAAIYEPVLKVIQGTANDDNLYGGAGADTYVISGGGNDKIDNSDTDGSVDTVSFIDLLPSDITKTSRDLTNGDLTFTYGTGQLTIEWFFREGWYYTNSDGSHSVVDHKINQFQFSDDTVWNFDDKAIADKLSPIQGTTGFDFFVGYSNWSETINGLEGDDYLDGGDGNDSLNGGSGGDNLHGDIGDDILNGDDGSDYLDGGDGNDSLNGGNGDDNLYGEIGDDGLNGDDGNDYLTGGDGNDVLKGGIGADSLYGDDGDDTYYIDNIDDYIGDSAGNDTVHVAVDGYRIPDGIENVIYENGAQQLPYFISALDSGSHWGDIGQTQSLTYSFATVAEDTNDFQLYTPRQQTAVRNALAKYSDITGLTFTETADSSEVQPLRDRSRVVPRSDSACVFTKRVFA